MTSTPTDTDTVAELPRQSVLHGQGSQYGSSSDTDVEQESVDQERGKDFIQKHLTLTFKDVSVRVTAPDEALGETLWSRVDPRQLLDLFSRDERPKRVCS